MHPFIPFVTEEIWLKNKLDKSGKNYLMFSNWINEKPIKNNEIKNVENIINFTSSLRSFKNELNISPGSFVDVSLGSIKNKKSNFYAKNENTLKKIARVNNFFNKDLDKPSATMVIGGDIIKIYFEENIDLKIEATRIAWGVKGVQTVINEIQISNSDNIINFADDLVISTKVKGKLILNENVNSLNYSIETVNKLVYIIGIAGSEDERELVINIAREVYGVEEVIDYISIKTDEF